MTDKNEMKNSETLQRLLFRRQFLLGPKPFAPTEYWSCTQLKHGLQLSVHLDLPFTSESHNGVTAIIIGIAIDPHHPQHAESDILHSLITKASDVTTLIESTLSLVGRWVIIFQNHAGTYLFTDPFGYRQVFYYSDGRQFWCGSQPEIIKANHQLLLATDETLLRFLMNPVHARNESAWVGPKTLYENCFLLMPNHYLSADLLEQIRFYPSNPILRKDTSEIVESACSILQGVMTALTTRYNVVLALTAGWDSRVLLAASRHVREHIEYFVDRMGIFPESHPDVWVPIRIAKQLDINFIVMNSVDELPGWFVSILSQNVTGARVLPKTRTIYEKLVTGEKRININGNGSEICRNFFDKYCKLDPKDISAADLARMFGYEGLSSFVVQELNEWRKGFDREPVEGLNILDMLYWEQRLGNWGALYPAEQDIALEEISPYNCRLLIETLLSSPRHLRAAPDYPLYTELIRYMWPEALSIPINPEPKRGLIGALKRRVKPYIPSPIAQELKRLQKT